MAHQTRPNRPHPTHVEHSHGQLSPHLAESVAEAAAGAGQTSSDLIRLRAYEISIERNGSPGDPAHDWLQAEQELAPQLATATRPAFSKTEL